MKRGVDGKVRSTRAVARKESARAPRAAPQVQQPQMLPAQAKWEKQAFDSEPSAQDLAALASAREPPSAAVIGDVMRASFAFREVMLAAGASR